MRFNSTDEIANLNHYVIGVITAFFILTLCIGATDRPSFDRPVADEPVQHQTRSTALNLNKINASAGPEFSRSMLSATKGVSPFNTRESLRRKWIDDLIIRNFIEVAENQWDFSSGRAIQGFGELHQGADVDRIVASIVDAPQRMEALNEESEPPSSSVRLTAPQAATSASIVDISR